MAIVTGKLTDFGLQLMNPYNPEIVFTPSGPATTPTGILMATRPITAHPLADGTFSAALTPTDNTVPSQYFTVSIKWLDEDDRITRVDFLDWKLYVPSEGGDITDLLAFPAPPGWVWTIEGTDIPAMARPGDLLLNITTSDLYRVAA